MYFNISQIYDRYSIHPIQEESPVGTVLVLFCLEFGNVTFYLGLIGGTFIASHTISYRIPVS
jgi:hypothetical protein